MGSFKIGLVGLGAISRAHIAAAGNSEGQVKVTAVADVNPQARQSAVEKTGAMAYPSLDELLSDRERNGVDGVLICTPPSVRVGLVEQALRAGVPVLLEKPLAHNLADARAIAELARAHPKVPVAVGYCHRFVPAVVEMKRWIETGSLGNLLRFENAFTTCRASMREHWMSDLKVSGGGSFIDTGCHSLDLFRFLVGDGQVESAVLQHAWPGRGDSGAAVLLRLKRPGEPDVAGVIHSGWLEPGRFTLRITGTNGALEYDYNVPERLHFDPSEGERQTLEVQTHEVRFKRQLLAFAHQAGGGTDQTDLADVADGVAVAQMIDSVYV